MWEAKLIAVWLVELLAGESSVWIVAAKNDHLLKTRQKQFHSTLLQLAENINAILCENVYAYELHVGMYQTHTTLCWYARVCAF